MRFRSLLRMEKPYWLAELRRMEESIWLFPKQMPMVAQAAILGGNARVGLEDNLYLDRGQLASNAQLVERAVEILERMGARVLGPEQVRERLSLRKDLLLSAAAVPATWSPSDRSRRLRAGSRR